MTDIRLMIPDFAADLMLKSTPSAAYDGMIKNNGLSFQEMLTFGMVIWPIEDKDQDDLEIAYVTRWENGKVAVLTHFDPYDSFLPLAGIEDWNGETLTGDAALEIFKRHVQDK